MSKFTVYGVLSVGVFTIVEAENEQQAREIASCRDVETVADAQGGNGRRDREWCLSDGTNGEVEVDEDEGSVEPAE